MECYKVRCLSDVFSLITTNIDYDERSQVQLAPGDFVMAVSLPRHNQCQKYYRDWTELGELNV